MAVARAARDGGFSAFFRSDHVLAFGTDGLPGPTESFVNLGAIAAVVPDIRLGTLVTSATFRHPSMTAIAAATVDDISGGRMGTATATASPTEETGSPTATSPLTSINAGAELCA